MGGRGRPTAWFNFFFSFLNRTGWVRVVRFRHYKTRNRTKPNIFLNILTSLIGFFKIWFFRLIFFGFLNADEASGSNKGGLSDLGHTKTRISSGISIMKERLGVTQFETGSLHTLNANFHSKAGN